MITHDEVRIEAVSYNSEAIRVILKYITQQEQFAKDVARLSYLLDKKENSRLNKQDSQEYSFLRMKLSKVGKEE